MAKDMNSWCISGRLTKDPVVKQGQNGNFTTFSVANGRGKKKDGEELPANFINCIASGKFGENIAKFFHKGDGIILQGEGQISTRKDEEGNYQTYTNLVVQNFYFPAAAKSSASSSQDEEGYMNPPEPSEDEEYYFN